MSAVPPGLVQLGGGTADDGALDLVVVPHAGGSPHAFRSWAAALGAGGGGRLFASRSSVDRSPQRGQGVDARAHVLAAALGRLERPYALLGHSIGALVALTATQVMELERPGPPPAVTVACATAPPHRFSLSGLLGSDAADLLAFMTDAGGTAAEVLQDPALRELALTMLAADIDALRGFSWSGDRLRTPVLAILGRGDALVGRGLANRWEDVAEHVDVRWFPGGHFFLHDHVPQVLAAVRSAADPDLRTHDRAPLAVKGAL